MTSLIASREDFGDGRITYPWPRVLSQVPPSPHADTRALQVTPSRYDLLLKPDLELFTFDGEVKIHVDVSEETKTVSLHAKEVIGLLFSCMLGRVVDNVEYCIK